MVFKEKESSGGEDAKDKNAEKNKVNEKDNMNENESRERVMSELY